MGVFLLFDSSARLVRVAEMGSGHFGETDPLSVFLRPDDQERGSHTAVEVAPEVLLQVRPAVFHELTMNAVREREGLRVDALVTMQTRKRRRDAETQELQAIAVGRDLAMTVAAEAYLPGPLPEHVRDALDRQRTQIKSAWGRAQDLRENRALVQVPPMLVQLAGQLIPL